jgi:integrase
MVLTGQRRGEIAKLRWQEISLQEKLMIKPGSETKNGKPHKTHLSSGALDELIKLKQTRRSGEFVFSFDGVRPVANPSHVKARLDKLLGESFEPWRIHDIRTALATALSEAGVPENIVDRILNHVASGSAPSAVARVYNQAEMLSQRARALDMWAALVTGEASEGNVLSFNEVMK